MDHSKAEQKSSIVLLVHGDRATRGMAARLLREAGLRVVTLADSQSVVELREAGFCFDAVVMGVAIGAPPFYRLCEGLATLEPPPATVLIGSVYSADAYKRAPTELYGAQEVVEEHRLEDLTGVVYRLLGQRGA